MQTSQRSQTPPGYGQLLSSNQIAFTITYMQQCLTLLPAHMSICVAEDEADRGEEVALAGTLASNDNIMFWRKWLNDSLIFVTLDRRVSATTIKCCPGCAFAPSPFEALNDNLFDEHLAVKDERNREIASNKGAVPPGDTCR